MSESNYWTRVFRKRMSRRAVLGAGAVAALGTAGVALVGCGGDGGGPTPAPGQSPVAAGTPRPGGILKAGRGTAVSGLDPHVDIFGLDIIALMYSFLYTLSSRPSGSTPGTSDSYIGEEIGFNNLATQLERPDELTYIFTIQPGVKFHPKPPLTGDEEVTPEEIKASFFRRSTALTAIDKRYPNLIDFDQTQALPGGIFKLVTKRPFVPAIPEMGNPTWGIASQKALEQFPTLTDKAFGSGPFMLETFIGSERIGLAKHPNFFVPERPFLDGREWIVIQDNSSLLTAFRSGNHDVNGATLTRRTADELSKQQGIVVNKVPNLFYPVVQLKVNKPPFNDPRVRQAIDLAINRDELIQRVSFVSEGEGFYNGPIQWPQEKWVLPQEELRQLYPHDLERAKALLAEAGYDQINTTMHLPSLPGPAIVGDLAALIKDQLGRANINVTLKPVELVTFLISALLPGNFEMIFFPHLPYPEPDRPLSFYHTKGVTDSGNWTGLNRDLPTAQSAGFSKEIDNLIDEQQQEFDEPRRREIILDVQRKIIAEHGPQLSLMSGFAYVARWDYVKTADSPEGPSAGGIYDWDIWLDKA